jgi:hypothetical protein
MKLTLGAARSTRIPDVLRLCPDDPKVAQYLNEAVMRLLSGAKWSNTVGRFTVLADGSLVTFPRELETVEAATFCRVPLTIRNKWYEFNGYGPGELTVTGGSPSMQLVDRGTACTFSDIQGEDKQLRVYADFAADHGKQVLFEGIDPDGNTILTNDGDTPGEAITLGAGGVISTKMFLRLTGVQKPVTKGAVRVYEYAPTGQRLIAVYQPSETLPEYRRAIVPDVAAVLEAGRDATLTVMGKLRFIPATIDTDYLTIGCVPALKDMCQAIMKRESDQITEAMAYETSAFRELEKELGSFEGDGAAATLRVVTTFCADPILNIV